MAVHISLQRGYTMQDDSGFTEASSDLFEAIVAQAPDVIIFADCKGMIRVWNHGAETVFGHVASEVLGDSLDVIIPERLRKAHWNGFHKAIDSGQTKHRNKVLTTRSVHKDGSKLYVANGRSDTVSVIDTDKLVALKDVPVGSFPWGVVIK